MKRPLLRDYKFLIAFIVGVAGLITVDRIVSFFAKSINIIPWMNSQLLDYSGILLLVLLLITFYMAYKQWIIVKRLGMLTPDTLTIVSDENTIFIGSNTNKALPSGVNAVATQEHPFWIKADKKYPQLHGAKWIADREHITNQEAISGGEYTFAREFEVPCKLSHVRSAIILLLVDDYCELAVNETRFDKVSDYNLLHRIDIIKAIRSGINRIQFRVENRSAEGSNNPDTNRDFFESNEKYRFNPYGLKYSITIEYFR